RRQDRVRKRQVLRDDFPRPFRSPQNSTGGTIMPNSRENMRVMKIFALIILILGLTSCNGTFWGTSYAIMNCSQFVCAYTHHQPATVRQLFDEGRPQHGPLHAGDIVVFGGRHAAVFDGEGLLDSIPE